ncbi:MAG: glycosyltransferase family 39 protein [Planctomycetota bacterium]|jgi:4-amino-4-deoxy-L-arabinose transferase-like glycosyltransferase
MPPHDAQRASEALTSEARAAGTDGPLWRSRGLWAVLAWGLLVRAIVGAHLWSADPLARTLVSDPAYYDGWARTLAAGGSFEAGQPYWLPPLYPWCLSLLYRVTGGALVVTYALQALLGLVATYLLASLAERCAGRRAALAAAWLWTLYAPVLLFEQRLLGINAALPLSLAGAWVLVLGCERLNRGESVRALPALAGLLFGVACLARPNLLVLAPLAVLGAWLGRERDASAKAWRAAVLLGILGFAGGLAPGLLANLERSGQPVLVSANGGVNFWFGNKPGAHGTFHAPGPEWGRIELQREVSVSRASEALGEAVDERRASAWWSARGRAYWLEQPGEALGLMGLKLADHLSSTEFGIQYVPAATRELAPSLWLAPLPFGLLLALGVVGIGLGGAARVRHRGLLFGWLVGALIATLLYFTYSRFRLPWIPFLLPFAGAGTIALLDALKRRGPLPSPLFLLLATVALAQSFVAFEGNYPQQLHGNALTDAAVLTADPELKRARLERALELSPGSARTLVELAVVHLNAGREDPAWERLQQAQALDVPYPELDLWLSVIWIGSARPERRSPERARGRAEYWLDKLSPSDPLVARFEKVQAQLPQ